MHDKTSKITYVTTDQQIHRSARCSSGPEVTKLFLCPSQLSMEFILFINVKMPINVGILTFISMINTISESLKARKVFIFQHIRFY